MGCYLSKPQPHSDADSVDIKDRQAGAAHPDCTKGDAGQHIKADAAGAGTVPTTAVVPQDCANTVLQQVGRQDLAKEEPVTTAAPDANVVKNRPNLPADEFEALTSAYKGAPLPPNEEARNASLCRLEQLDTPEDPRFNDITQLLCSIFHLPIAIVSLVDSERQWFKSIQGLAVKSTERKAAFCAWTFLPVTPEVLVVPDALLDGRFKENPLVLGPPHIRFYAGAPLIDSTGCRLGSLCVLDRAPRNFDAENCNVLCNFAEVVVREMEKDKLRETEALRVQNEKSHLLRAMDCFTEGVMLLNVTTDDFKIIFLNDAWARITGFTKETSKNRPLWDLFEPARDAGESLESATAEQRLAVKKQQTFTVELNIKMMGSSMIPRSITANFRPAATQTLDESMPLIGIHGGYTKWSDGKAEAEGLYFVTISDMLQDSAARLSRQTSLASSQGTAASHMTPKSARKGAVIADNAQPFEDLQLGPLLGQGSFGKVYRGMWSGAPVAVKIIQHTDEVTGSDGDVMSLSGTLEAMHSVDLAHPNVVQTYKSAQKTPNSDKDKNKPQHTQTETWLVLEYCDRGTLQDLVDRGGFNQVRDQLGKGYEPNLAFIRDTAREIAAAMCYLHSLDILHGDLTGGNILLISSNKDLRGFIAKVADFGLSRVLSAEAVSTGTYGTVTHMPIELLTTGKLGKSTDVYAFGVILWELLTGQRPWAGLLQMQVIFHVTIHRKRLELPDTCEPGFKSLCEACMSTESSERPRFTDVLARLDAL